VYSINLNVSQSQTYESCGLFDLKTRIHNGARLEIPQRNFAIIVITLTHCNSIIDSFDVDFNLYIPLILTDANSETKYATYLYIHLHFRELIKP